MTVYLLFPFNFSFILEDDDWEDETTFGASEIGRSPKVVGRIARFNVDCMVHPGREVNLLSSELWSKILV